MAIHANLTENKSFLPPWQDLLGVLLNQAYHIPIKLGSPVHEGYSASELVDLYNGYSTGPLVRGSQVSLLNDDTLIDFHVEKDLESTTGTGIIHVELPRHFTTKLTADSGTDDVCDVVNAGPFSPDEYVIFGDNTGAREVNQILSISSNEITWYNTFSKDWLTANNAYIGYGGRHHYGGDTGSTQENKSGTWESAYMGSYRWNEDEPNTADAYEDATGVNDGTNTGTTPIASQIGKGILFDATNDVVNLGSGATLDNIWAGGGTIEITISADTAPGSDRIFDKIWILSVQGESGGFFQLVFDVPFSGTNGQWKTAVDIPLSANTQVIIDYNGDAVANNPIITINDDERTVGSGLTETSTPTGTRTTDAASDLLVGNRAAGGRDLDGSADECTISDESRSADWKKARYNSWTGVGIIFGAAETVAVGGIVPLRRRREGY